MNYPVNGPAGAPKRPLELWGGPECSVVRVGDDYRNQAHETGHAARLDDLDAIAALGIRTIRFPLIWETVDPKGVGDYDWSEVDGRLERVRALGLTPIAGLVHHGSGPPNTSLIDPDFPRKLARYAAAVAERYPWIEHWTPVNEPLTTARFSCLYGYWYPHRTNEADFACALVNQCYAVLLAMEAIRAVNPRAKLVQTEDYGRVFSTPGLRYQADFENARRLLGLDLLCGSFDPDDFAWIGSSGHAVAPEALARLKTGAARPDMLGINHYLTSDRFIDERVELYLGVDVGGNGRDAYVDVEAVRVDGLGDEVGIEPRLAEIWRRYGIPIAVTEVHNGCTREEQVRWLVDTWRGAQRLRDGGVDVRAITIWSMFGAVDWCSLLTRREGRMEHGIFDLQGGTPRRTLLGSAVAALATDGRFSHPVLNTPGWWKRPTRFVGPHVRTDPPAMLGTPLLITGATGVLGHAFARICEERGIAHRVASRAEFDIADPVSVHRMLTEAQPWAVVDAVGFVSDAERERDGCARENSSGPERLAMGCAAADIPLVAFSSDLVFGGVAGRADVGGDAANPTSRHGASRREAERRVLAAHPDSLVIRAGAFHASGDAIVSPISIPDLVHATLDLLVDGERGLWRVADAGAGMTASRIEAERDDAPTDRSRGLLLRPHGVGMPGHHRDLERAQSHELTEAA